MSNGNVDPDVKHSNQSINDIRQSNHEVGGKVTKPGVQVPQSADMSSIIPDLILERPGPPSNDD